MDNGKPKLLDQLRQQIRARNYSICTGTVYAEWAKRHIRFHRYRHQVEMGRRRSRLFSPTLRRDISASMQNQALMALLFLHKVLLWPPLASRPAMDCRRLRLPEHHLDDGLFGEAGYTGLSSWLRTVAWFLLKREERVKGR